MSSHFSMTETEPSTLTFTPTLKSQVEQALDLFFTTLDGHSTHNLYALVLREVEEPLLRKTLKHTGNNQVHAATLLGLSRGTLRKKMELYGIR